MKQMPMVRPIQTLQRSALACGLTLLMCAPALAGPGDDHPGRPGKSMPSFKELDANQDGKLTPEEFRAQQEKTIEQRYERLDRDHDGKITAEEFEKAGAHFRDRMHRRMGGPQGSPDSKPPEGLPNVPHFDEVDTSGDNVITLDEFQKAQVTSMTRRFEHVDEDRDGFVTEKEYDAARARFQERMKDKGPGSREDPTP